MFEEEKNSNFVEFEEITGYEGIPEKVIIQNSRTFLITKSNNLNEKTNDN
jgi:hypothetical protein